MLRRLLLCACYTSVGQLPPGAEGVPGSRSLGKLKFAWVVPKDSPFIGVSPPLLFSFFIPNLNVVHKKPWTTITLRPYVSIAGKKAGVIVLIERPMYNEPNKNDVSHNMYSTRGYRSHCCCQITTSSNMPVISSVHNVKQPRQVGNHTDVHSSSTCAFCCLKIV